MPLFRLKPVMQWKMELLVIWMLVWKRKFRLLLWKINWSDVGASSSAKVGGKRFKVFYAVRWILDLFGLNFSAIVKKIERPIQALSGKGIQQRFGLSCPLKFSLAGKEARYKEEKFNPSSKHFKSRLTAFCPLIYCPHSEYG